MAHAPELLFHHYDGSPFSEKIRLAFGRKGLRWRSVIQPNMMPKPQLVPLTGGYRRIPVLQLGTDVYCDSQLIARVVERLQPAPTLFPGGSEGACFASHWWADRELFQAAVPAIFEKIGAAVPKAFIDDRTALMGGSLDFGAFVARAPPARGALRARTASRPATPCASCRTTTASTPRRLERARAGAPPRRARGGRGRSPLPPRRIPRRAGLKPPFPL